MKKNEFKVKAMIAVIYTLAFVLYGLLAFGLDYYMNYSYPDAWWIVPSVFRGMTSSEAAMYCLTQDWWWLMLGGIFAFGLIAIPNAFYLLISNRRELEK